MIIEPTATTTEQIAGKSSSTATTAARPLRFLFTCAKRHPATPIRKLRLAPSSGSLTLSTRSTRRLQDHRIKVKNRKHADFASWSAVSFVQLRRCPDNARGPKQGGSALPSFGPSHSSRRYAVSFTRKTRSEA